MEQNKTGRYLKYAIGEIILVVIGILIALQINNWNEDKKLRVQELKYLKNLRTDVLLELKTNDSLITYRANTAKAAARILVFETLQTPTDVIALEQNIQLVFRRINFIPTNNTFKELLSSGNLNSITNDSIKDYLLELEKKYASIGVAEHHMYREYEGYLYDVLVANGEALNLLDLQKTAKTGVISFANPSQIDGPKVITEYNRLLQNTKFINGLKLSVMNNIDLSNNHASMTDHLEKLIEFINDELNSD
jgi:hypothetical protein